MTEPLVSVIIPVFNREHYLAEAIESVRAQTYRPIEVIVVDDGSMDKTEQIVGQYGDVRYLYQSHQGVASARNTGISVAGGEIIAFLDSDDLWPPGRLTITVRYFEQYPEIGYVLGKQMMFIEPGCEAPPWVKAEWLAEPQDASNTAALVVHKKTFGSVGFFNPDYRHGEDTEWLVRANEAGVPMKRMQEVVVFVRVHEANLSTQMMQTRRANLMKIARESIRRQKHSPRP